MAAAVLDQRTRGVEVARGALVFWLLAAREQEPAEEALERAGPRVDVAVGDVLTADPHEPVDRLGVPVAGVEEGEHVDEREDVLLAIADLLARDRRAQEVGERVWPGRVQVDPTASVPDRDLGHGALGVGDVEAAQPAQGSRSEGLNLSVPVDALLVAEPSPARLTRAPLLGRVAPAEVTDGEVARPVGGVLGANLGRERAARLLVKAHRDHEGGRDREQGRDHDHDQDQGRAAAAEPGSEPHSLTNPVRSTRTRRYCRSWRSARILRKRAKRLGPITILPLPCSAWAASSC